MFLAGEKNINLCDGFDMHQTSEGIMPDSPKDIIRSVLRSLPAAVPHVGAAYANFLTDQQLQEIKDAIERLSEEQKKSLSNDLEFRDKFSLLEKILLSPDKSYTMPPFKLTVVIPCGGKGGNLFPMTQVMPKCLVFIKERTLLQHIIDPFYQAQDLFEKVIIVTGDYHDAIQLNVQQGGFGDFVECRHIGNPSVSAGLMQIAPLIETDKFLLHYNDILIHEPNWKKVIDTYALQHKYHSQIGTLLCSNYYPLGVGVITEGPQGTLKCFEEKPQHLAPDKLINIAVAIFEKRTIKDYCVASDSTFFRETLDRIKNRETLCLHKVDKWHHVQDWNALYRLQHEHLFQN